MPPLADDRLLEEFLDAALIGFDRENLASDVTYQELIASGSLSLLRDPAIREGLISYYRESGRLARNLEDLAPFPTMVAELTGYLPYEFVEQGRELTSGDRRRLLQELRASPQLARDLRALHASLVLLDRWFVSVIAHAEQLLASLE